MGRAQFVAAIPLQLLSLQHTKTNVCRNKWCMEKLVVTKELSANISLSLMPLKPFTAAAPGPSGHTTPNLTSALWTRVSAWKAAGNSDPYISVIPQQGPSSSNNQSTQKPMLPALLAALSDMETKGRSSSDVQDTKGPLSKRICNPPKDTAAHSTPPDSSYTRTGLQSNRKTT